MSEETIKDLEYWKNNAEEDYRQVPISVLRYISELENALDTPLDGFTYTEIIDYLENTY